MKKIFILISFLIIVLTPSACNRDSNIMSSTVFTTPTQIPVSSPTNAPTSHGIITVTPVSDDISINVIPNDSLDNQIKDNPVENDNNIENTEDVTHEVDDVKHLEFYDEFDKYNSSQEDFKGFILSEVWIDGEAYYQFLNEGKDVKIVVDQTQENAIIYHDSKSMDYDMGYLFDYAHLSTDIELCDVTGDEEDELIIFHDYVGFGTYDTYCDVINLSTMKLYNIGLYFEQLCSKITVEPIKITEDDSIVCRVTDINGNISYGTAMGCGSSNLSDYSFEATEYTSCSVYANYEKKCLSVNIDITLCDVGFICSLGSISSDLILNTNTNCFELSNDFNVSIDEIYYSDSDNSDINVNETIEPEASITSEGTITPEVNENLCKNDEEVVYSFRTSEEQKVVTLCINNEKDYIIFRYGTQDKIEIEYPDISDDSWNNFAYCYYLRGGGPENEGLDLNFLTFKSKEYSYILYEKYYAPENDHQYGLVIINNNNGDENDISGSSDSVTGTLIDFRWNSKIIEGSFVDSLIEE
jgi:hypothetical protein